VKILYSPATVSEDETNNSATGNNWEGVGSKMIHKSGELPKIKLRRGGSILI